MTSRSDLPAGGDVPEPTVLDLFKSVTKDLPSFVAFLRSLWDSSRRVEIERSVITELEQTGSATGREFAPATGGTGSSSPALPWRSLLALLLALYAQTTLEPPSRTVGLALPVYVLAMGLTIWSWFRGEWQLPALPTASSTPEPLSTRTLPLIASLVLALIAFWDFGSGLFSTVNVFLWTLAILLLVVGLWLGRVRHASAPGDRHASALRLALVIGVLGLALFFRLNKLQAVPAEPFSDHAEKILDVYDITQGKTSIFFPRNTGREAIQMYWTWLVAKVFGTGLSFASLKIGTALLGLLTLPYVYLLGGEIGGRRVAILTLFLFGIAYWPNLVSRMGLRFPLYPLFVAPTLFHVIRGLRTRSRNDFILAGLFLGLGLHGYSPFRIMPLLVALAFVLFVVDRRSHGARQRAFWWLAVVAVTSLYLFLPLLRYSLTNPAAFSYRAFSRLGSLEAPLPGPAVEIFLGNVKNALLMFNRDDGEIWVHSVPHRPALDVVTGALFVIGALLLFLRWMRSRTWRDALLLLSIPVLLLPSILSLAFPAENPALNRASGAAVPAILTAALALDGLIASFGTAPRRLWIASATTAVLLGASALQNYDLVFHQFDQSYRGGSWNSSEMGEVLVDFRETYGRTDTFWIVPYPHWVDTRLPAVWAGIPNRDLAIWPGTFADTVSIAGPKLFVFRPEDADAERELRLLYPDGLLTRYASRTPGKDFMIYLVSQ